MFVVVYRWKLIPGREDEFREAWQALTDMYIQLRGQQDGKLRHVEADIWEAEATWMDQDSYLMAHERGILDPDLANRMNAAIKEPLEPEFRHIDAH
ncbi:MAG: hypothetical protein R3217_05195 [Gammaproteobacteria bacterium]|nr:hypothetical protein [Gammaproteobacteria bacterium]